MSRGPSMVDGKMSKSRVMSGKKNHLQSNKGQIIKFPIKEHDSSFRSKYYRTLHYITHEL
jgi:hypothetical protein